MLKTTEFNLISAGMKKSRLSKCANRTATLDTTSIFGIVTDINLIYKRTFFSEPMTNSRNEMSFIIRIKLRHRHLLQGITTEQINESIQEYVNKLIAK